MNKHKDEVWAGGPSYGVAHDSSDRLRHRGAGWSAGPNPNELILEILFLLFADDMQVFFDTYEQARVGTTVLMQLLKRFGLAFHVSATPTGKSKSVCLFVPAHYRRWEDGDTRSIPVDDVGFISLSLIHI